VRVKIQKSENSHAIRSPVFRQVYNSTHTTISSTRTVRYTAATHNTSNMQPELRHCHRNPCSVSQTVYRRIHPYASVILKFNNPEGQNPDMFRVQYGCKYDHEYTAYTGWPKK